MSRKHMLVTSLLILALGLPAWSAAQAKDAEAEKLYKARCMSCHAADGSADTPAGKKTNTRDFALPEVWKMSDAEWVEVTAKGRNKMPPYGKALSDEQIKNLVAYIRTLVAPRAPK